MEYHYRSKRLKRALPQGFHAITFSVHFSEVSAVVVELFTYSKISKLESANRKKTLAQQQPVYPTVATVVVSWCALQHARIEHNFVR